MSNTLEPIRRVVTGHTKDGKAYIVKDELEWIQLLTITKLDIITMQSGDKVGFSLPWTTDALIYDLNDERDLSVQNDNRKLSAESGQIVRIVDMAPKHMSPTHRTVSLDYGVVMNGTAILHLDDGVKTLMKPGEICVQRGTIHAWENPSETDWCRVLFILSPAKPFLVNGKPLGDEGYQKAD